MYRIIARIINTTHHARVQVQILPVTTIRKAPHQCDMQQRLLVLWFLSFFKKNPRKKQTWNVSKGFKEAWYYPSFYCLLPNIVPLFRNEMDCLRLHVCTSRLYWVGTTWAKGVSISMNHAPGPVSLARPVDLQPSVLPLCYGCTSLFLGSTEIDGIWSSVYFYIWVFRNACFVIAEVWFWHVQF